ncbi:GntR family transcriptional regulator [Azospirillum thermophilum]|uniref:GntR family transcriptional regulator n=1 Tax=Azospirillum thermophilum TaxID=2202148 RepID=A0A2S2CZ04_9PROT|nr:GntR family transcriptional regulator [Azospirillum thermophilum]AWK89675.1 GntR family transcriptional regulator [Azospirillum thermophilum]
MSIDTDDRDLRKTPAKPTGKLATRAAQRPATAATAIYRDLRHQIVSLHRKPGDPINEKQIAQAYGVSRTPVREAVLKLADEGLIEVFPQSGTFVARIPVDALPEASEIRKALELTTVRLAAANATRSQIAQLRAIVEMQHEVNARGDADGFHQSDEAFHALIAEISGFPGFWTITQQVKVQMDRCRRLTLPMPGQIGKVIAEHEAIVEAIAGHDPDRATLALSAHLDGLRVTIHDIRHATPAFFIGAAGFD